MTCIDVLEPFLYLFSRDPNIPNLLYYTHLPVAIIALFFGWFVYKNNKNGLANRALLWLSMSLSVLIFANVLTWINNNVYIISFLWNLNKVMYFSIPFLAVYVFYLLVIEEDIRTWIKGGVAVIISTYSLFTFSRWSVKNFDIGSCNLNDNSFTTYFLTIFFAISVITLIVVFIKSLLNKEHANKKVKTIIFTSILLFLTNLFFVYQVAFFLDDFRYEMYALIGLPIFIGALAFAIVRYKLMNIKLLGAQALVVTLMTLIGSEFFFVQSTTNIILVALTFIVTSIAGINLIKSVKKEVEAREEIEVLAKNLDERSTELKTANDNQTNLIHVMNHQIKGRLGNSRNIFAELLTGDYGQVPDTAKPLLEKGLEETTTGVNYVTTILKGASAESGTLPFNLVPMDFKALVTDVANKQQPFAERKGLQYTFTVEDGTYQINGDATQLSEAVKNLIDNSINYTPSGSMTVSLRHKDGKILFGVKDTGVGITDEDKAKLFRSGGRGKDSLSVNVNSTGYGLAFVKGVVNAHQGHVWAESEGKGKGSQFYIELPEVK